MIHAAIYTCAALILLTWIGNLLCALIFRLTGLAAAIESEPLPGHVAGRVIGVLERLMIALGIVFERWEVLAAVIALKSVARFKEMDKRKFAEYFQVGSLFSLFWAVIVTGLWMSYDHQAGMDLRGRAHALMGMTAPDRD